MNFREYLDTFLLVRNISQYRESQMREIVDEESEFDENYYRVDDKNNDKRGNY